MTCSADRKQGGGTERVKDSLFQLRSEQLAGLLGTGAPFGRTREARTQDIAQRLHATLDGEIPLNGTVPESLPSVLRLPCTELHYCRGLTLVQVLLRANTDVAALRILKDYAKELVRRSRSEEPKAVATAVYFAAIAAAMVFHNEKITGHSHEELGRFLSSLLKKPWLPADLKCLLEKAEEACRSQSCDQKCKGTT